MGDHRHRLSVVLGDKVEDLRTKQELMDELQEMEIKLDKAGVVGLQLYEENQSLHGKLSEMTEQINHEEELIEMLRSEVTQSSFERDRLKAAVLDYTEKIKLADADHRALTDRISHQDKALMEANASRDHLKRKIVSLETTLQHVHETYGDQHDQHVGVGSAIAERELQKIEKEKKSLMMKELLYTQKERMYKSELKKIKATLENTILIKNNSEKSLILVRERAETLSHRLNTSLDELHKLKITNAQLATDNSSLKSELDEVKALHEEHKATSPNHRFHRNSIFGQSPRPSVQRKNTLLTLYTVSENLDADDVGEGDQAMNDIIKTHETAALQSKRKLLDRMHSKSQLHIHTKSDQKHKEKLENRIKEVDKQLKDNLDGGQDDDYVVIDDEYVEEEDEDESSKVEKKAVTSSKQERDGVKKFFKNLSHRRMQSLSHTRVADGKVDLKKHHELVKKLKCQVEELEKTVEMKEGELRSLQSASLNFNSLLREANDATEEMESDLRFSMRELDNIKEKNASLEAAHARVTKDLQEKEDENSTLREAEVESSATIKLLRKSIDELNEKIKKIESDLQSTLVELKKSHKEKALLEEAHAMVTKDLQAKEQENSILRKAKIETSATIESLEKSVTELNEKLKIRTLNIDTLEKQNEASQLIGDKMMQLQADIIVLQEQKDQEIRRGKQLSDKYEELQVRSASELRTCKVKLQDALEQNTSFQNMIRENKRVNEDEKKNFITKEQEFTLELKRLTDSVAKKEQEMEALKQSLAKLGTENASYKDHVNNLNQSIRQQNTKAENTFKSLEELKVLMEDKDMKLDARKKSIARMAGELSSLRSEKDSLNKQLKKEKDANNAFKSEKKGIQEKISEMGGIMSKYTDLQTRYEHVENENKRLTNEVVGHKGRIQDLTYDINHLEKQVEATQRNETKHTELAFDLEKKVEFMDKKILDLEKLMREKNQKLQMYHDESIEETQALSKALDDLKVLEKENNKLKASIADLHMQVEEKDKEIGSLAAENKIITQKEGAIDVMKHEVEHLTQKVTELKAELKDSKDVMTKKVDELRRKELKTKTFLKNTEDDLKKVQKTLDISVSKRKAAQNSLEKLKMEYSQLEHRFKKLYNEYEEFKASSDGNAKSASIINELEKQLSTAKNQTLKVLDLYHNLEHKYKESEKKLKTLENFNTSTTQKEGAGDHITRENNEPTSQSLQRNVEKSTADSQKIRLNDDEDMAQHNINVEEKNLIAKLSLKRSKVLQALEIIYRGVGPDNLKKSLSDDRVQTAVQEYKDMKKRVLLRHKSSQIELDSLKNTTDRINLLKKFIHKETEDLERCIWLIQHLAKPASKSPKRTAESAAFRRNIFSKASKVKNEKKVKQRDGYGFQHLDNKTDDTFT